MSTQLEHPSIEDIETLPQWASDYIESLINVMACAREFVGDWRKGDFDLGTLAACDARSMEEALKRHRKNIEKIDKQMKKGGL